MGKEPICLPKVEGMSDDIALLKNQFKEYIKVAQSVQADRDKAYEELEKSQLEVQTLTDKIAGAEAAAGCPIEKIAAPDTIQYSKMASPVMWNYFSKIAGHDGFVYSEKITFEEQSGYGNYVNGWYAGVKDRALCEAALGAGYSNLPPFSPYNAMVVTVEFIKGEKPPTED